MHRTTRIAPFGLTLRREPSGSLSLSETKAANENYSTLLTQHFRMMGHDRMHHLMREAEKETSKARHTYKHSFGQRVRQTRQFSVNDMVYVDNRPAPELCQESMFAKEHLPVKLRAESYDGSRWSDQNPSETIDIDEIHNVVASGRVTFLQETKKVNQDANRTN